MNPRQEIILKLIVEEYIQSAEPVGSKFLCDNFQLNVSPATIRNDMVSLEHEDYLRQPHTSAGRIPTEKAYQYYLKNVVSKEQVQVKGQPFKDAAKNKNEVQQTLKQLARQLVEVSGETAIVASEPEWSYYTGVSNLFSKPDFQTLELVETLSEIVDRFDEVIFSLFGVVPDEPVILIGSKNPFGNGMSAMLVRYKVAPEQRGLLGLVGPLRMNYSKNLALLNRAKYVIDSMYDR